MLKQIHFENFKNLKKVTCDIGELTVVVGPNASGKTSLLEGLHYLSQLVRDYSVDKSEELFRRNRSLQNLHYGDGSQPLVLEARSDNHRVNFKAQRNGHEVDRDRYSDGWRAGVVGFEQTKYHKIEKALGTMALAKHVGSLVFLRLEASQLAKPSYSIHEKPRMEYSGAGLATVLATMKLEDPENFATVIEMMKDIVPHLCDLKIRRQKIQRRHSEIIEIDGRKQKFPKVTEQVAEALYFDFTNRSSIPANNVSEGTLLALGLITVLQNSTRPSILLLDDIEKGLHPNAQKSLVDILRKILKLNSDLQIIATTHSPFFLDFVDPSEVRVMAISSEGDSVCSRLNDAPKFEKWKEELAPGEMWSLFGESWVRETGSTE